MQGTTLQEATNYAASNLKSLSQELLQWKAAGVLPLEGKFRELARILSGYDTTAALNLAESIVNTELAKHFACEIFEPTTKPDEPEESVMGIEAAPADQGMDSLMLDYIEAHWFYRGLLGEWLFYGNDNWDAGNHPTFRDAVKYAMNNEGFVQVADRSCQDCEAINDH